MLILYNDYLKIKKASFVAFHQKSHHKDRSPDFHDKHQNAIKEPYE